jgi:tetratricopeptide (TPR) repeat protein
MLDAVPVHAKDDAAELLRAGEQALEEGDPERAAGLLERAAKDFPDAILPRLARALNDAYRKTDRHRESLAFLERQLAETQSPQHLAVLLQVRLAAMRQLDTRAVLDLADEALAAAEAVKDEDCYANVLANAAFAAYRRGDVRAADRFAALAAARVYTTPRATIDALRARMFAATAGDGLEASLGFSRDIRERLVATGQMAAAANECNNVAEALMRLGRSVDARAEAERAAELSARAGHRSVEQFAKALAGVAACESGDVDGGIALLRQVRVERNEIFAADLANVLSFWLVERKNDRDAAEAVEICSHAADRAATAGVSHCLTSLLATQARALGVLGRTDDARLTLARARSAAYAADAASEQHLALAMAEVFPVGDPARSVSLNAARARLLRGADRRQDPRAYCTGVRLHRRLLELSGGVPEDLPQAT